MSNIKYIEKLYNTVKCKDYNFDRYNYRWLLGVNIINDILANDLKYIEANIGYNSLFGIRIDIDYYHPNGIKIFRDITNEI